MSSFAYKAACALVGAVAGAASVLGFSSLTEPGAPAPARRSSQPKDAIEIIESGSPVAEESRIFLAWAAGGVPARTEAALEKKPGVRSATTVDAGLDWIRATRGPSGEVLDRPPDGMRIPFENAYVDPAEYAEFVPSADRELVRSLGRGEALLSATSSELRGGAEGLQVDLGRRRVSVSGVISDVAAAGYEAVTAGPHPSSWVQVDRYVLVRLGAGAPRNVIQRTVSPLLEPGQRLRVRTQNETPFLRYGDAVLPQLLIKETFGEFAARAQPDGFIEVDKAWRERNIRTETLPLLGEVTCHRLIFPQLRATLADLRSEGLSHTLTHYGGCYSPRFVNRIPGHRLSHHAWGIALDLNVAENSFSTRPDIDPRLVACFESHGFTWGGDWLVPDGMHFEWVKF